MANNMFLSQRPTLIVFAGYRHVYLEGMAESSIFVHVGINDMTGKVQYFKIHLHIFILFFKSQIKVSL